MTSPSEKSLYRSPKSSPAKVSISIEKVVDQPLPYEPSIIPPNKGLAYYGTAKKILGQGTYGKVSLYSRKGAGDVAIKMMKYSRDDEGVSSSTLREIASLLRLSHPNVVSIIDIIVDKPKNKILRCNASGQDGFKNVHQRWKTQDDAYQI